MAAGCLLLAQIVAGVTFSRIYRARQGVAGNAALPLAAGMFLFLLLNFMNAFAFTYPYTLPFMRGLGWVVFLAAGIALSGTGLARIATGGRGS